MDETGTPDLGGSEMRCIECGAVPEDNAHGWRGYRADHPDLDEPPELVFYCPECAEREFG